MYVVSALIVCYCYHLETRCIVHNECLFSDSKINSLHYVFLAGENY